MGNGDGWGEGGRLGAAIGKLEGKLLGSELGSELHVLHSVGQTSFAGPVSFALGSLAVWLQTAFTRSRSPSRILLFNQLQFLVFSLASYQNLSLLDSPHLYTTRALATRAVVARTRIERENFIFLCDTFSRK